LLQLFHRKSGFSEFHCWSRCIFAPITSTIRSIPTEVLLTADDGLPNTCAANLDNIQTVPKANISAPITHLSGSKMKAAAGAIGFALGLDTNA
jgi:mRNA interferase MazF